MNSAIGSTIKKEIRDNEVERYEQALHLDDIPLDECELFFELEKDGLISVKRHKRGVEFDITEKGIKEARKLKILLGMFENKNPR